MSQYETIARPYAKALFELAKKEKDLGKWSQMLGLARDIAQDKQMISLMKNPQFSREKAVALFLEVGKDQFSPQMQNSLHLLGKFKRLNILPEIFLLYEQMRAQAERVINVKLISAFPVEEAEKQRFMKALKTRMDRDITLECIIDKSILGGAIIQAEDLDLVMDGSILGRLAKLGDAVGIS